jgi:hypothetical protein
MIFFLFYFKKKLDTIIKKNYIVINKGQGITKNIKMGGNYETPTAA